MKIMRIMKIWIPVYAGMTVMLAAMTAHAEDALVRTISVVGEAKVAMVPDRATFSVEVQAKNIDLDAAKKEHDDKLRALLKLEKKYDIAEKDQRTHRGSIYPEWRWQNNTQVFQGYRISTNIGFTLDDLEDVGPFLEDIVRTKPQSMNGPNYHLDNTKPVRDRVRVAAMKDALAKAKALAKEGALKVGKPITISDRYQQAQPIMKRAMMRSDMAMPELAMSAAPVAPPAGEQQVHAQVYVTYELID